MDGDRELLILVPSHSFFSSDTGAELSLAEDIQQFKLNLSPGSVHPEMWHGMAIFPSKLKVGVHRNTHYILWHRRILSPLPLFSRVVPDCGYHIYWLIKGLSELDTSPAPGPSHPPSRSRGGFSPCRSRGWFFPCPNVRNIRLTSLPLRPGTRDQAAGNVMCLEKVRKETLPIIFNVCKCPTKDM